MTTLLSFAALMRRVLHRSTTWITAYAVLVFALLAMGGQKSSRKLVPLAAEPTKVAAATMSLPIRFEPNRGQFDESVRYGARGPGYGLYLTKEGATLSLRRRKDGWKPSPSVKSGVPAAGQKHSRTDRTGEAVLTMHLLGGRAVEPTAAELQTGTSNYLIGGDPSKWRTRIDGYSRVRYPGVLPGVELVFYGTDQKRLEYDLVLAPGVNPSSVSLSFEGAVDIEVSSEGEAVLALAGGGEVRQHRPVAYQIDDAGVRTMVDSRYRRQSNSVLGFDVGKRDVSRPLVIDPALTFSAFSDDDEARGIAMDSAGCIYVAGIASVTKIDPTGPTPALVYSTHLGGSNYDEANGIAVDRFGNAYVVGMTQSSDFPLGPNLPGQGALQGSSDAFVARLDSTGTSLVYSTYLGGESWDEALAIAVDKDAGIAYVTGYTKSAGFPNSTPVPGQTLDADNAFVTEISAAGTEILFSTLLGGSNQDLGRAIAIDKPGNILVAGYTRSRDFLHPTPLSGQGTLLGLGDAFVTKIDPNPIAPRILYSTFLGGPGDDGAHGIAVDASGSAYVTGFTASAQGFPGISGVQPAYGGGGSDAFVAKINSAGTALTYLTYLGGAGVDSASGIAVDTAGNAYVTGSTYSADFPLHLALPGLGTYGKQIDAFVSVLNPTGAAFVYSTYLGGSHTDYSHALLVGRNSGIAYVAGSTKSVNFPTALLRLGVQTEGSTVSRIAPDVSPTQELRVPGPPGSNALVIINAGVPGSGDLPTVPAPTPCNGQIPAGVFEPGGSNSMCMSVVGATLTYDTEAGVTICMPPLAHGTSSIVQCDPHPLWCNSPPNEGQYCCPLDKLPVNPPNVPLGDICAVSYGLSVFGVGTLLDSDGDGIANLVDNCPLAYNPLQEDSVGNGVGDACRTSVPTPAVPPYALLLLGFLIWTIGRKGRTVGR